MGEHAISWLQDHVRPAWNRAFISALFFGLIAHIYKFTNTLLIHDSLYFVHMEMGDIVSGRWLLYIAGLPSSCFDLPWINGLLALVYIGLTAAVVVDIFKVENRVAQVLTGALLATFPCVTNTFFFEFSADAYMLSMLFAALAVRFSLVGDGKKRHMLYSAVLLCLSLGIYQSYLSFALLLSVCHFMWELLRDEYKDKEYLRWIGRQLIIYAGGAVIYVVIWKLTDAGTAGAASYQGIDQAGGLSMSRMAISAKDCLRTVAIFFLGQNVLEHGWTVYAVLNLLFLTLFAVALVVAVVKVRLYTRKLHFLLLLLCVAVLPFFACIWFFASPGVFYHPLMLQSLCVLYIFTLYIVERYFSARRATAACLLFTLLVFKFTLHANVCYHQMNSSMERTRSMAVEMLTRVHMLDDGHVERIAIIGNDYSSALYEDPERYKEIAVSANQLRTHLLYTNIYAQLYLHEVLACDYEAVYDEELEDIKNLPEVAAMALWPEAGSVKIIGDTAVIRLPVETVEYR